MAEIRETHVKRDEHGRVTDTKVVVEREPERRRRGGGFGLGLLLGVLLFGAALLIFAYSQGSFQSAGREADQLAAVTDEQLDRTADSATEELAQARAETDRAENALSDTATN